MVDSLLNLSSAEILALTLIGEARGEPIEGQVAVACVCRNRMFGNPAKYHSYKDVVLEEKQFSCWNESDPNRVMLMELADKMLSGIALTDPYYKQCMYVAQGIDNWSIMDNTNGALNYMTKKLFYSDKRPKWADMVRASEMHGSQIFFVI